MSNPAGLSALEYEPESTFGEDVTTFASLRLPLLGPADVSSLTHAKIDAGRGQQYRNAGSQWMLGIQGGTVRTRMYLAGHGTTTSGATSLTALETLLGIVIGNADVSAASGTTFTGGTATAPTTTASGTFGPGSIGFGGSLADGRGNGQAFAVGTHSTTTLNLLTAMPTAPTNGDVLYSAVNIYPSENPTTTTVTSVRMRFLSGNLRYELHGCVPTAYTITGLNTAEFATIEVTWAVAWWRYTTGGSFPSTVATDSTNSGVNAGGSFFLNSVGTATRATRVHRNLTLECTMGMQLLMGPGGNNAYQGIVGARRTSDTFKLSWEEDADAATTSPVLPGLATGTTSMHALITLWTAPGSRCAIYFPNLCISNVPTQVSSQDLNRLRIEAMAYSGSTTTSDRTLSAMRIAFA